MERLRKYGSLFLITGTVVCIVLVIIGEILISRGESPAGGVCIGLGMAGFALTLGYLFLYRSERRNPRLKRAHDIERNDERLSLIRDRAGARVNAVSTWVIFAATIAFILLNVELYVVVTLSGILLLNGVLNIVYTWHYNRKY